MAGCRRRRASTNSLMRLAFDPLTITRVPSGETLLAGELVDQGALFGILLKIRDLGLPLLTVSPNPDCDKEVDHVP